MLVHVLSYVPRESWPKFLAVWPFLSAIFFLSILINLKQANFIEKVVAYIKITIHKPTLKIVSSFHISIALQKDLDEVPI